MKSLKLLTFLSVLALAPATGAFADNSTMSPNNPNCSPGVQGCTANYATTDHSDDIPKGAKANTSEMAPNCSPGQQGCTSNYATTDHSDDVPKGAKANPPQQ